VSGCSPAGVMATSFTAEVTAALCGLQCLHPMLLANESSDLILVTDSRSLTDAIRADPYSMSPDVVPLFQALCDAASICKSIHIVWVSSHCGLQLNDQADMFASDGTRCHQNDVLLSIQAAKSSIKASTKPPPPLLDTSKLKVYEDISNRRVTVTLNQLLTGHSPILQSYLHRIDQAASSTCDLCQLEPEDAHHLLITCPARAPSRHVAGIAHCASPRQAITDLPHKVVRFLQLEKII